MIEYWVANIETLRSTGLVVGFRYQEVCIYTMELLTSKQAGNAWRLGKYISETARLVDCSQSAFVSIYAKWINYSEIRCGRQAVGRPLAIKENGRRSLTDTFKHGSVQQTSYLCCYVTYAYSETGNIKIGS
ncbi:hypothetical protein TNCV_853581 [Trichonephila clavipes]|nr:hypothetical protein TNCV_853581 [Trichonephila clavipes]